MRATKGFVLGAVTAYLFDPSLGRSRRQRVLDRVSRLGRRGAERIGKKASFAGGKLRGLRAVALRRFQAREVATDDAAVLQRIRSDALRDVGVSTRDVDVTVEDGVATLTGSVATDGLAEDLVSRVRKVPGVEEVAASIRVSGDTSSRAESDRADDTLST